MAEKVLATCIVCFAMAWLAQSAEGEAWYRKDTTWHYIIAGVGVASFFVGFGDVLYLIWR